MKIYVSIISLVICFLFFIPVDGTAITITINFDGMADSTMITNQYEEFGVTFSNSTILTSGVSLNDHEFPPKNGTNVVFDDGGFMLLSFSKPIYEFGGYFTYTEPINISFSDILFKHIDTVNSKFNSNIAISGDIGSSANEFISFSSNYSIYNVLIQGNVNGGSFTFDDLSFSSVPEPTSLFLVSFGIIIIIFLYKLKIKC